MEKIPVVESAKALMTEAVAWSVMKWLREKKTVRKIADQANAALDQLNQATKDRWPHDVKFAYQALIAQAATPATSCEQRNPPSPVADPQAILTAKKIKEADDEAHRARIDAEKTFDAAEKQLSTAVAREGCRKAIHSWELHEKAIRKSEAIIESQQRAAL